MSFPRAKDISQKKEREENNWGKGGVVKGGTGRELSKVSLSYHTFSLPLIYPLPSPILPIATYFFLTGDLREKGGGVVWGCGYTLPIYLYAICKAYFTYCLYTLGPEPSAFVLIMFPCLNSFLESKIKRMIV